MSSQIVPQNNRDIQLYFTEQFAEGLYIDNRTGEVFASYNSLSRLVDKPAPTVHSYVKALFNSIGKSDKETAEVYTPQGLRTVELLPETVILSAIKKYKPALLEACSSAGLRVYLHGRAGFATISTAVQHAPLSLLEQTLQDKIKLLEELKVAQQQVLVAQSNAVEAQVNAAKAKEAEVLFLRATQSRPGLAGMLENDFNPEQRLLPSADAPENVTAYEWMSNTKMVVLEGTMFRKFISKIHGAYKAIYHEPPKYEYRKQENETSNHKKVQVYGRDHYGLLQQCYIQTLMECDKP